MQIIMTKAKKIVLTILVGFTAIQFIRPADNSSNAEQTADLLVHFDAPANVAGILRASCYDCHSNNTHYPWYSRVQPIGWMLANHVKNGKQDLNFNEFAGYSLRRQLSKMKSIENSIKDGSMPLSSYLLMHSDAKITEESKASVIAWTEKVIDSLSSQ